MPDHGLDIPRLRKPTSLVDSSTRKYRRRSK
nr:MAG TPA: hypothetical protein [Caudoviricetes sp.]